MELNFCVAYIEVIKDHACQSITIAEANNHGLLDWMLYICMMSCFWPCRETHLQYANLTARLKFKGHSELHKHLHQLSCY